MPVSCKLKNGKWRIVDSEGKIEKNDNGTAVDGGGHSTKNKCQRQANAINSKGPSKSIQTDLTTRTYQLRADTLDEDSRSIGAVIATENPVLVMDWSRFEVIEEVLIMSGCRIPEGGQVPMLDTHDRTTVRKQYGSTRELRVEGDKLLGRNFYSNSDEAEHAWQLTREKHLTDNSIGYRVTNGVRIEPGKTAEIEGREFKASANRALRVAIEWEVRENSVCAIAADDDAKNRNESNFLTGKDSPMDEFKEWLTKRGLDFDELSDEQRTALKADFEAERERAKTVDNKDADGDTATAAGDGDDGQRSAEAEPEPVDVNKVAADAVTAERQRVNAIRALGGDDVPAETIERCITEGSTIEQARAAVLTAIRQNRPQTGSPAIHVHDGQTTRQLIEDGMLLRAGYEDVILEDKKTGEQRAGQAEKHRDVSMLDVCRQALMLDGLQIPTGREDTIRAAFSTVSLPVILGNVAKKSLMKGYNSVPATWRNWCSTTSVSDFKEVTGARLTDTGELEEVGNSGEVKYGAATEETEKYSVTTYAKNFGVTRQNVINDDLDAITKIPKAMGARAGRKPGDLVYAHLLANGNMSDGVALFHADHKNLNTSAALAKDKLAAAVTAFAKQTNKDGQPINVEPKYLVVPPDLRFTGAELIKAATIVIAGSTDTVKPAYNALSDLSLVVVTEVRLSNSSYSGYSTTTWYLMGDKNIVDTIVVAFLMGKQTPTIERFNAGPDVMGIIYRVFFDVGCKSLDFRGMQKNTA
ncbi:MAG: hypothetical protein GWN94_19845 [Phycisphaerae bacterium]|nr:hypothetical protein [Phycisphaerae bacterium]NIS53327.1 hypothetical protein [Phycisphaerae bacterium]NIX30481.1 hypothetical protein [Phycisphaerae bacterium]